MKTKVISCPDCDGRGHTAGGDENSSWWRSCLRCHGTGYTQVPLTFADKIRAMSDEELCDAFFRLIYAMDPANWFCKGKEDCRELMDADKDIPDEMCKACLLQKLRQPYVEPKLPSGMYLDKQYSGLLEED